MVSEQVKEAHHLPTKTVNSNSSQATNRVIMSGDNPETSLSIQLANLLKNSMSSQTQTPKLSDNLQINLKLNNQNYALWTRMIRVAIGGRSKALLSHLTSNPPSQDHESHEQWEQEDLIVFSWLIQNIEPIIAGNLTEYPTAKMLWDALVVTYSSGRDKLQTFNLHVKANDIKQNDSTLEELWIILQGVWGEIDRIDPNPMKCPEDIHIYAKIRTEQKLFQFLHALDRKYESIKREILRSETLPSAEAAYAMIRKEAAHQNILGATNQEPKGIGTGLITTTTTTETESLGLATKGYRRKTGPTIREDKSHLKCEYCGMTKHTKDQCFQILGYPDWWTDGHKKSIKSLGSEKGGFPNTTTSTNHDTTSANRKNQVNRGNIGMAAMMETQWVPAEKDGEGEGDEEGYQDGSDLWAWH